MKTSSLALLAAPLAILVGASPVQVNHDERDAAHESFPGSEPISIAAREGSESAAFNVPQIVNPNYKQPDALAEMLRARAKYGSGLTPELKTAVQKDPALNAKFGALAANSKVEKGSVSATAPGSYDSEYVVPVRMGNPVQQLNVNIDTGSGDFWVFSSDTNSAQAKGHTLYKPKNSKTSKKLSGQNWGIQYGDGTGASGIVYTEQVRLGKTWVNTQAVESAVEVSSDIASDTFSDGIMGLASSAGLNTVRPKVQKNFLENVQSKLAAPLFTANLRKGKPGNYNFGYIDPSEYKGSIQYAKTDPNSPFWKVNITGFQVGASGKYYTYSWPSIVDTGTTLLLAPKDIVQHYYNSVKGASLDADRGMYTFPCSSTLPNFYFGIGSYRGMVPGSYMNYGQVTSTRCYGGIQLSTGMGFSILGDILLKAQFVVFSNGSPRQVGFANKANL